MLIASASRSVINFTTHKRVAITCLPPHEISVYQFVRMLFGLNRAPATFQRAVEAISSLVKFHLAFVYLDGIDVF